MTTARRDFTVALGITTCVSLAGNVAAATLLPHDLTLPVPVVIAAASVAPLLLPGAVHLVPKTAGLPSAARRVVVLAVVVSAIAAFALSFASLAAVAQASGHGGYLAMLLPIAVDVLAAAAALALVLLPPEGDADHGADHDATDQVVERTTPPAAGARDADQDAAPDRVMARHAVDDAPASPAASQPVTSSDEVTQPSDAHLIDAALRTTDLVHEADHDAVTRVDDAHRDAVQADPVHADVTRTDDAPVTRDAVMPRRLASVPAEPSDRDAEILRRTLAGESAAQIGDAMGMSKSTALRNIRRVTEAENAASSTAAAG